MWAYWTMCALLRLILRIFYRQVEVVGLEHVPPEGEEPVIFAGNHPNSLIDPAIIVTSSGRIVHFAAKDVLFSSRLLRIFLSALGAVPIKRRADHGAQAVDNAAAFDALTGVLAEGRCVGIFPEGISHDAAQLARLKTGAARIALSAMSQHSDLPLQIIPCGLTFIRRKRFRSRVLVQFGDPIRLEPSHPAGPDADERQAARELTDQIEMGLRALTINAPDWETLRVLDGVRRLYQPPKIPLHHRVELARRFARVYQQVRDEPGVAALFARVKDFIDRLADIGVTDAQLSRPLRPGAVALRILAILTWTLIWLPLAVPGMLIHAPIGVLVGWGGERFAPRKDVAATTKLLLGLGVVLLTYAALGTAAFAYGGLPVGLATCVLMPLTGYATVRVLERTYSLKRLVMRVLRVFLMRREVAQLRELRVELEDDVVRAVETHLPADMEPLYPRVASAKSASGRS